MPLYSGAGKLKTAASAQVALVGCMYHVILSFVDLLQEEGSSQADLDQPGPDKLREESADMAIQQLQHELQTALANLKSIEREAEVAKEAAGTELVLMRRQLTSCQAALVEAEQVFLLTNLKVDHVPGRLPQARLRKSSWH